MKRLALVALLLFPAPAAAAPPVNDGPRGALGFEEYVAENGTPEERQAVLDLTEATADKGVPRCLGPGSFAKTVWLKVPAEDAARRVTVEASSPSGGTSEIPDLALYVGGQSKVAQSCDGAAVGRLMTSAAAVEAVVPAGRSVLVQIGRSGGQMERKVVASLRVEAAPAVKAPRGDTTRRAPRLPLVSLRKVVVGGATLTREDPAQPACPAAATVWRRTPVKPGDYRVVLRGSAAGSLTVFLGRPSAHTAKRCVNRRTRRQALSVPVRVRRRTVLWTRIGADRTTAGARVKAVVAPG